MNNLHVVSADSHFLEPPTLWTERLNQKYRDRGPHTFTTKSGVVFLTGEDIDAQPVAGWCAAGRSTMERRTLNKMGWDAAPKEVWEPADRLKAQDRDGIMAEVLFTSFGMLAMNIRDVDLATACLKVFNDYAAEFCSYDPVRLIGVGAFVPDDVGAAVREMERLRKLGLRGVMLPLTLAEGDNYGAAHYDPIWAAAQDMNLVITFHAGTSRAGINPKKGDWARVYAGAPYLMPMLITDMIFGGVLDRFPNLKLTSVENDVGWLPHFAYRMTHFAEIFASLDEIKLALPLEDYIKRHFRFTFQFEGPAIEPIRHILGSEVIMWGNDFPHLDSTWPDSPRVIRESLSEVMPANDVANIVYNNVVKHYDLAFAG